MEPQEGAALAYVAALQLWVVVNSTGRIILWTSVTKEAQELDMLITKAHVEREAKVLRLQVRREKELVLQLRGTEVAEVAIATIKRRRRNDHGNRDR